MKKNSIITLQIWVVFMGICTFVFLLWEPQLEGRNAQATLFEIYFKDPFLTYAYIGSTFFFAALYQIFKVLHYIGNNEYYSELMLKAVRKVKYYSVVFSAFVFLGIVYIFIVMRGKEDIVGGMAIGIFAIVVAGVITFIAAKFERYLHTRQRASSID